MPIVSGTFSNYNIESVLFVNAEDEIDFEAFMYWYLEKGEGQTYAKYSKQLIERLLRTQTVVDTLSARKPEDKPFKYYKAEVYSAKNKAGIQGSLPGLPDAFKNFGYYGRLTVRGGIYSKDGEANAGRGETVSKDTEKFS